MAGSDTTATVIRIGMMHIATSPLVYQRLQREIDEGIKAGRISSPITDAEARELPYLQALIKECFRIWPPITGIMPRMSDHDGEVCGQSIPANTHVGWSAHAVLRDKAVFGPDAELFSPERWLRASAAPDKLRVMENTVELVFGQGRWGCLGKPISLLELNKVFVEVCIIRLCILTDSTSLSLTCCYLSKTCIIYMSMLTLDSLQLLRRFDFTVINPSHPMDSFKYGVSMQSNLLMRISQRDQVL